MKEKNYDKFFFNKNGLSINSWICNIGNIPFYEKEEITIDNIFKLNKWKIMINVEKGTKESVKSKLIDLFIKNKINCKSFDNNHIELIEEFSDNDEHYENLIKENIKILEIIEFYNSNLSK